MKRVINFGNIDFLGTGKKINQVTVELELTDNNIFKASGDVWDNRHTDIICGGQCLDDLLPFFKHNETFKEIFRLWKAYHLNDMHAGTPKQEQALKNSKWGGVNANFYSEQCKYLESVGLLYDDGYKFGSGWLKEEIQENDIELIKKLIKEI